MKQPHEWARSLCLSGSPLHLYRAAAALYGWDSHRHHYSAQPLVLSEVQFTEAVERAARYPQAELLAEALSPCSLLR